MHMCLRLVVIKVSHAMTGQELREDSGKPLVDPEVTHIAKVCQAPSSVVLDGKGRTAVLMNSQGR